MPTFADEFEINGGAPIDHAGFAVHRVVWLRVQPGDEFAVAFRENIHVPEQGLRIGVRYRSSKSVQLQVNGVTAPDFVFWAKTVPEQVVVRVLASVEGEVGFWNVWRSVRYGTMLHALNNAGISVSSEDEHGYRLSCSDGYGPEVSFQDYVVDVQHRHGNG